MAIKEQCLKCKQYRMDTCGITDSYPNFNQTPCQWWQKSGINLDKQDGNSPQTATENTVHQSPNGNMDEHSTQKQRMFSKPFSFKGRIRRSEYILSYLIACLVMTIFNSLLLSVANDNLLLLLFVMMIPIYWFIWAQGAKRCHDRGNSGWYQLIPFYVLWMLFGDGDDHENDYGSDPKGRNNHP